MSVKKLINALFQMSGSRAMPNPNSRIELQNGITTYVAPFDGWFYTAQSLPQNTRIFVSSNGVEVSSWSPAQNSVVSGGIPVAKGQTVTIEIPESASPYWTYFTNLVGGGAKSLLA